PMTSRKSSGSSRVDNAVDPTRSQNITVIWRRSAMGRSPVESPETRGLARSTRLTPHSGQNLASCTLAWRQAGQTWRAAAPHWAQNLLPSGQSAPQLRHPVAPNIAAAGSYHPGSDNRRGLPRRTARATTSLGEERIQSERRARGGGDGASRHDG